MLKLNYKLEKYPDYQYDILQLREGETYQIYYKNTLVVVLKRLVAAGNKRQDVKRQKQ